MKCDIDYNKLKELLIEKYWALEVSLYQCFQIERYCCDDENGNTIPLPEEEYTIEAITEDYITNTNNRFFFIWKPGIMEKYCHDADCSERAKGREYVLVRLGLSKDNTRATDIFYVVDGYGCQLSADLRALNKLKYPPML